MALAEPAAGAKLFFQHACERGEKWHCYAECAWNAEWKRQRLIIAMPNPLRVGVIR